MALMEIDSPVIVALRGILSDSVSTYKLAFAEREASKQGGVSQSLSKILSLPMTEEESDELDGTREFCASLENSTDDDSRKAIVYANISKSLSEASEYFKGLADLWAKQLPSDTQESKAMTDEQLKELAATCNKLFQDIIDYTESPDATGQPYKPGARGGNILDIPRFKIKAPTESTQHYLYVNGHLMNQELKQNYMSIAVDEAFSLKVSEFVELLKAQGHSIRVTPEPFPFVHDGKAFMVKFTTVAPK
jgi:hypothetical protein